MWRNHYSNLLNSIDPLTNEQHRHRVSGQLGTVHPDNNCICSFVDVQKAIKLLKTGKASGPDGLSSEHYKFADDRLCVLLALFFTCAVTHGYLPASFMNSTIVPLLKNKTGDITDPNNYRPIALSSMCSKVFERIILNRYDECFSTSDNQFGFKKNHATDLCVYAFKDILNIYRNYSSPLYICFLDASKAFDKLNYWLLFDKLLKRNMPKCILRIIVFWYTEQCINVQWGNQFSTSFNISNGVRQGGILSPLCFNVYMDDLSLLLNMSHTGCNFNNIFINHLSYADDMCIIAPSARSLQTLLDICQNYSMSHNITYNTAKSVCMYVKCLTFKVDHIPQIKLGGRTLDYVSSYRYLGCIISDVLTDELDIKRTIRGVYTRSNILIRKFNFCSFTVKQQLFQSYCTNFYCTQLWYKYSAASLNKIRVAFNNSCRHFLGYPKYCSASGMFLDNNIDSFDVLRRKYIYKFTCRLFASQNSIIESIYTCNKIISPSVKEWTKCLFTGKVHL